MSKRTFVIGAGAARFNWLPVFLAERLGLFEDADLGIEIVRTGAVDKATAAVREGTIDLAITPPEGAIKNAVEGGNLRLIAGNSVTLPLTLVANAKYTTVESLRGARLGTSSLTEGTALYTMEMLRAHGLNYPGDYEFNVVGVHPARWKALQENEIDAAVQPAPLNLIAIDAGYTDLGEVSDYIPSILFAAVIVDARHAEAKRSEITDFLRAVRTASEVIYAGEQDALLREILADINEASGEYAQRAIDYMRDKKAFPVDLALPESAFETSVDLMIKAGVLDEADRDRASVAVDRGFLEAIA